MSALNITRRKISEKNQTEGWVEEWNAKEEKELPKAIKDDPLPIRMERTGEELPDHPSGLHSSLSI